MSNYIKNGESYSKYLGNGELLRVEDWGFSSKIEVCPENHFDPKANEGWEEITEQHFNYVHTKVSEYLKQFLP